MNNTNLQRKPDWDFCKSIIYFSKKFLFYIVYISFIAIFAAQCYGLKKTGKKNKV